MPRILLVEDEDELLETLSRFFQRQGYSAYGARSADEALALVQEHQPDVAVVDVMLQHGPGAKGMNGFEICRALRQSGFNRPVIFLTALTSEQDKLLGFEVGGDDYVTKPFSLLVLNARVQANLKRAGLVQRRFRFGDTEIDLDQYIIRHPDGNARLRNRERELLRCLLENRGKILSRERLLKEVWGSPWDTSNRTVDTHIRTLRQKLRDDAQNPRFIETLHGVGYRFIGEER